MKTVPVRRAAARGAVHATVGIVIAIALLVFPRILVLLALATSTVIFLLLEAARLDVPSFRRYFSLAFALVLRKEEENQLTGGSYLLIGALVSALLFRPDIASLAITFLALGDPAAGVVGTWIGIKKDWHKDIEGNLACFGACFLGGSLISGFLVSQPPLVVILGAASATVFQALPLRLNDNLTIPIGSGIVMVLVSGLI